MGIRDHNLNWLSAHLPSSRPLSMLELGNQHLKIAAHEAPPGFPERFLDPSPKLNRMIPAKQYFESLGIEHTSVDRNGKDAAIRLDLTKVFELKRRFDVGTDFGTSEHVEDLWACLENLYRHVKPGGTIVHANPEPGSWPRHGRWYRAGAFYTGMVELSGDELIALDRFQVPKDGWETRAVLRRGPKPFPPRAVWQQLPVFTS